MPTDKIRDILFGNPIVNECNNILRSCGTKEERMRVAPLIRSKLKFDSFSNLLLNIGEAQTIA